MAVAILRQTPDAVLPPIDERRNRDLPRGGSGRNAEILASDPLRAVPPQASLQVLERDLDLVYPAARSRCVRRSARQQSCVCRKGCPAQDVRRGLWRVE